MSGRIKLHDTRVTGTIAWWDNELGRGAVVPDGEDTKIPIHYSHLVGVKVLYEGQRVLFERSIDPFSIGHERATRVTPIP